MGYYNFNRYGYDKEALKNVPTIIKAANERLQAARGIISSIKIPGDFFYSDVIKQASSKIDNMKRQLESVKNEINNIISTLYAVQAANNNVIANLANSLIHGKRSDKWNLNTINRKTMKKELIEKLNSLETKAYTINGKTQLLTNAEYIGAMSKKVNSYDSNTNFSIIVDAENAQVTIFERENKKAPWKCLALWDSIQGVREPGHLPGNIDKVTWKGPLSRSFTGAFEVHGRSNITQGFKTCYCGHDHSSNLDIDDCQGFEPSSWGNPDLMNKENRFESHGCTNLNDEKAKWIYFNIPDKTKVVVFNGKDEWPHLDENGKKLSNKSIKTEVMDIKSKTESFRKKSIIENTINVAMSQLGKPYNYAPSSADPDGNGFDCSGLVWWSFEQAGYEIPHAQCYPGKDSPDRGMIDVVYENNGGSLITEPSELERGDLLFYNQNDYSRESNHVAIYLGNNERIHAGGEQMQVMVDDKAFNEHFIGGGPIIK
ncbi:MAG: C40 family peptidase [Clostridia bacterium]|nr:C40 family peptidase [Clostridia bacterium]